MTTHSCREMEPLLGRDTEQLSDADRLRLEHHLTNCASCRTGVAANKLVRDLMHEASPRLSQSARERVLSRALAAPVRQEEIREKYGPSMRAVTYVAALAACGVVAFWFFSPSPESAGTAFSAPSSASGEQVERGTHASLETNLEQSPWIEASTEEKRIFAHATVSLPEGARVRFDAKSNALSLAAGRIEVDVDPKAHTPFSVHTAHFQVQVLGTQFTVSPDSVQVTRGTVRVVSSAGEILAPSLTSGESFHFGVPKIAAASPNRSPKAQASQAHSAAQTLQKAREALARGDTQAARALLAELPPQGSSRKDRAEAATLTAEIALLERDPRQAMSLYLDLAKRFSDLPAGENACFAASQLAARAAPEREAQLLDRYLTTYPQGRFVQEAKQRLEKLRR